MKKIKNINFSNKHLIVKDATITSKGNGIRFKNDDINYWISLEVLEAYGITKGNAIKDRIIILDEKKELAIRNNWIFINSLNILSILDNENEMKEYEKNLKEKNKLIDKSFENDIYVDKIKDIVKRDINIDFSSIYNNIDFYKISENKTSMTKNEKLIQKSIKLKPTKYNNGKVLINDYNFSLIKSFTSEDISKFIKGEITSLKIKKLSNPKIPIKIKDNPQKIITYLEEVGFSPFMTKTDKKSFEKGIISLREYIQNITKRANTKFTKINDWVKKSLKIKRETGINPLVIAWPYVLGKTNRGTLIHAPITYRNLEIKESLNEYEFIGDSNLIINTYPILKQYSDNNGEINEIVSQHSSLKSALIEFFKHGIKITKPETSQIQDYKHLKNNCNYKEANNFFELSNEAIFKIKPSDEYIYYDLKNIIKEQGEFELPNITYEFPKEEKPSSKRMYVNDVDNSKAIAIETAIKKSVAIFGPPGTGKSETITGIIGELINSGKNSIFVAEKATAIEVIETNLKRIGLNDFVINLNNGSKIEFTKKFNNLMELVHNTKYKKIINKEEIDFAIRWMDQNKQRELTLNNLKKQIGSFEKMGILIKLIDEIRKINRNISLKTIHETINLGDNIEKLKCDKINIKKKITSLLKEKEIIENKITSNELCSIKEINKFPIITKIFNQFNEIEAIAEPKDTSDVVSIIFNEIKPRKIKKKVKLFNMDIKEIIEMAKGCIERNQKLKNLLEINQENLNKYNNKKKINNKNILGFHEILYKKIEEKKEYLLDISESTYDNIMSNFGNLFKDLNLEWENHLKEKENHLKTIRNVVKNNYSINFKTWIKENKMDYKLTRIINFINNKLNNRTQNIIKLFQKGWEILIRVFPSVMMNPDLVSLIFPTDKNIFDFSIFDEASQIRLHKAIPSLHRGKVTIVSGDDKQLGPSDLFTNLEREEDFDLELEEDTSLSNQTLLNYAKDEYYNVNLTTHYRSKSKDLIEFSNKTFYDNRIMVADTPNPLFEGLPPIIVEEINGIWQIEYTNKEEAIRAVDLIIEYRGKGKTVGVITFNEPQKKLINDILIERKVHTSLLDDEYFFIKSIKEVQGDEMDVIIFSIAYGKRKLSDSYTSSFGRFSKEKINVAITRSKIRIHVLKSIPSSKVSADNDDKLVFKRWLEFIENYSSKGNDFSNYENKFLSDFERDYFDSMQAHINDKYTLLSNYDVGTKSIDLVIYDNDLKQFIGAIELDGLKYHSKTEDVLKDYERQVFLENMGWIFVRTTPLMFYSNRSKSVEEDFNKLIGMFVKNNISL